MKKHLLILSTALCLFGFQAAAQTTATFTAASDYLWRGYSFTNYSGAAIQGDLSHSYGNGFTFGLWAGNIAFAGTNIFGGYEFDPYLTYTHDMGSFSVYGTFMAYMFPRVAELNSNEYTVGVNWNGVNVSASYMADFFNQKTAAGASSSYMYFQANYAQHLQDNLYASFLVGHHDMEKSDAFIRSDFSHAKVGLQVRKDKTTFEMAFSKTFGSKNEKVSPATNWKDEATVVSMTTTL